MKIHKSKKKKIFEWISTISHKKSLKIFQVNALKFLVLVLSLSPRDFSILFPPRATGIS